MVKTNEADDRPPNQTPIPSAPREVSPEQLQGILENHAKWRESGGREGLRADLQDAVLIRRELQGVNLSGALLQRANLQEANLKGAKFSGANLEGVDLRKAQLKGADFSKAKLRGANLFMADLQRATLWEADLQGARLISAQLQEADLVGARLAGAELDKANISKANLTNAAFTGGGRGTEVERSLYGSHENMGSGPSEKALLDATVAGTNFGMATLTGAKLPESLNEFRDSLQNVADTSRNARRVYVSLIALCAFALLAVATTTDAQLVIDNFRLKLPLLGVDVSVVLFYISAPILGLGVFVYLHMYLSHLWELAARLPAVFSDGLPLRQKLYPWMLNLVIDEWQREEARATPLRLALTSWLGEEWERKEIDVPPVKLALTAWFRFSRLQAITAILLGWGLLPLTIAAVGYRFLVRHDARFSFLLLAIFTLSVLVARVLYGRARATIRGENFPKPWRVAISWAVWTFSLGFFATRLGLAGALPGTIPNIQLRGVELKGHVFESVDLSSANLSFANLSQTDMKRVRLRKADMHGADLSNADLDGVDMAESDLRGANVKGANLSEANLEGANLSGAKLQAAILFNAQLTGAHLRGAQLQEATLIRAQLEKAVLIGAQLEKANLGGAELKWADLSGAHLNEADLLRAQLQWTKFVGAELRDASLRGAELQGAILRQADLQGADLRGANLDGADLSDAQLSGSTFEMATLHGTQLDMADLRGADFRLAKGLTAIQIKAAKNWALAFYPDDLLRRIGLPREHNKTLPGKLREYERKHGGTVGKP